MIYLKHLSIEPPEGATAYPFDIPALRALDDLSLTTSVTFLVGENGTGKSTLLEAIGTEAGFNVSGGRSNAQSAEQMEAPLADALRLSWLPRTSKGMYLRAETLFNYSTYIDETEKDVPGLLMSLYDGKSLHARSHGEAFMTLFTRRFREGLYLLDEPEAALSPTRQLSLMRAMRDCEKKAQFIIATHSPMLLAYPGARILLFDEEGIREVAYDDVPHVRLTRSFLERPERYLGELFG